MIPANPGWVARLRVSDDENDLDFMSLPVEAWDEEGFPLVVDDTMGLLIRANQMEGFKFHSLWSVHEQAQGS